MCEPLYYSEISAFLTSAPSRDTIIAFALSAAAQAEVDLLLEADADNTIMPHEQTELDRYRRLWDVVMQMKSYAGA